MKVRLSITEKKIINFFCNFELERKDIAAKKQKKKILPNYVLNRHIKMISNGEVVFDSKDFKQSEIPVSIQYSIKKYGYPELIGPNNKTPLIYNITSKATSLYPSK